MGYTINRERVRWRIVDDEAVLIDVETSHYYSLNRTGTLIWQLLTDRSPTIQEIVRDVAGHYSRDESSVHPEVHGFVDEMVAEGLVVARPSELGAAEGSTS
jgi:hypothetical protein